MKEATKVLLAVSIFALLIAACAPQEPQNRLEAIKQEGKIVVGTSADYEPWEYKDENDEFAGIDMDIMREVARRMGVDVEFQDLGFDALVTAVQEGKVDAAIAAMTATEERKQSVDFSISYFIGDNVLLATADSGIAPFDDPKEMASYKVGTQSGTNTYTWIEENLINTGIMNPDNLFLYERNEQVALDLRAGRIDLALMDLDPGKQYMADPNFGFVEIWRGPMDTHGKAIAIRKGEDELKAEIDKHLQAMIEEGFIEDLLEKYGVE